MSARAACGKCRSCALVYVWRAGPTRLLIGARCADCGGPLAAVRCLSLQLVSRIATRGPTFADAEKARAAT